MPGELFGKLKDLDANVFKMIVEDKLENNPSGDYQMKMPDYLSLGSFGVPDNIKDLYLKRFAYTKFFKEMD